MGADFNPNGREGQRHSADVMRNVGPNAAKGLFRKMIWKDAILKVLGDYSEPLHYTDIAQEIAKSKYRKKNELGANPAHTVLITIVNSIKKDGDGSPFRRSSRGYYTTSEYEEAISNIDEEDEEVSPATGIINALGMYWERSKVIWKAEPQLLGKQQQDSKTVDFSLEVGVYLLHDAQGIVYVGRTTEQNLGKRLQQHTVDRLNGRWDRFSWFGIYPVQENGKINTDIDVSQVGLSVVISTLEAVLIEGLEPRQNRRRGDDFQAVEFLQVEDPALEANRKKSLLAELAAQLGPKILN